MAAIIIALCILALIPMSQDPMSMKWYTVAPWEDCPDCKGEGRIEINYKGSDDWIECPCTQELR